MEQSPTSKQPAKAKDGPRRQSSLVRDAMVLLTVPLVSVAVMAALFLQFGQPIIISMAVGGMLGGLLIALHTLHRRAQTIASLRGEVGRLNAHRIQYSANGSIRQFRVEPNGPVPVDRPTRSIPEGFPTAAPEAQSAVSPTGHLPVALDSPANSQPGPLPPPLPPSNGAVASPAGDAREAPPPPSMPKATSNAANQPFGSAPPLMSYWDLRPGAVREASNRPLTPTNSSPTTSENKPQNHSTGLAAAPSGSSPLPPEAMSEPDSSGSVHASDQELATMQSLIEQLAAQLNDPGLGVASDGKDEVRTATTEARQKSSADGASRKVEQSIEASLSALKVTAESMRKAPSFDLGALWNAATSQAVPATAAKGAARPHLPQSPYSRLAELTEAVAADRIDVYLDPIHGLGDRKARHFEVGIRLRSPTGEVLGADDYMSIATGTGLLAKLDQAQLKRSARVAEHLEARNTRASLFSQLSGESLVDDDFLDTFESVLGEHSMLPNRLILTFAQRDVRAFSEAQWDAIMTMSEIGVRFAIDEITDLDMEFSGLKEHGFDYAKLDAEVFLEGLPTADGPIASSDICRHLSEKGLSLIVGAIGDEMTMAKLMVCGVALGQGALFGGPRPVKIEVVQTPSSAAA